VFALDFDFSLTEGPCGHKQTYDWGDGVVVSFDGRCGSGQTPPTEQVNGSSSPSTFLSTTLLQGGPVRDTVDSLAGTFTSGTGVSIQTLRRQ
jgi:hypothetical protein